jgi:peptide/nickel transport system permease protein
MSGAASAVRRPQEALLLAARRALEALGRGRVFGGSATLAVGVAIVATVVLACFAAPLLGLPDPNAQDLLATSQAPSLAHPFGTDALGRDVLARTLDGGRLDLRVGLIITYVPMVIGVAIGALAGFFGGWLDATVMRLVDIVMAFPFIILAIGVVAIVGPGLTGVYIAFILVGWGVYTRLTRAEMLVLREQQFMLAARTLGYSRTRAICVHGLPNLIRPNVVFSMADLVINIGFLASLSYLGLGVQPPTAEWGSIIADGQASLLTAWWISTLPGLVLVLVGVGFSLVGDGLADRLGYELKLVG